MLGERLEMQGFAIAKYQRRRVLLRSFVGQTFLLLFPFLFPSSTVAQSATSDVPQWSSGQGNGSLATVVDKNPDPHILEFDFEARVATIEYAPGETIDAFTYNGVLPGPLIRAQVGDRLIVHFSNHLPQPTTVHWHGLRVPIEMDGVPGVSQDEVKPGGTFTYDFTLSDAGLYWYHPHVMSAAQVGFGLYGAILVEEPNDGVVKPDGSKFRERVLVISDIGIDTPGVFEHPESGGSGGMAFGRDGNRLLVNGQVMPTFAARVGETERWRVVNTAKSRYFEVDLGSGKFTLIGVDGGLQELPTQHDTLVLAPGERADVLVRPPGKPGETLVARALLYNRGYGSIEARMPVEDLFRIHYSDEPEVAAVKLPKLKREIKPISTLGATHTKLDLVIFQHPDRSFEYAINEIPFLKDHDLQAKVGETQIWTLNNKTKWSHPFHLHGFFFQELDENEQPVHPIAWKDTIDVPFEKTTKIIVKFDDRPGMWMTHCHILDHADGGLMGMVHLQGAK
jgi:FtsP/CotA-like multicopper oxidase with cupredoxin domain